MLLSQSALAQEFFALTNTYSSKRSRVDVERTLMLEEYRLEEWYHLQGDIPGMNHCRHPQTARSSTTKMWDEKGGLSRSSGLETAISEYLQSDSEAGLSAGTIRNKGQRWVHCFTDNVSVACMVRDEFLISLPFKSSKVLALS